MAGAGQKSKNKVKTIEEAAFRECEALTNVIGFIIQGGYTLTDLLVAQIGTQPMLTASPAAYPLIKSAEAVLMKLKI